MPSKHGVTASLDRKSRQFKTPVAAGPYRAASEAIRSGPRLNEERKLRALMNNGLPNDFASERDPRRVSALSLAGQETL